MADTALDLLLQRLRKSFDYCETVLDIPIEEDEVPFLYQKLESLRTFLKGSKKKCYDDGEIKDLVTRIVDLGFLVADDIDCTMNFERLLGDKLYYNREFDDTMGEIDSVLELVMKFSDKTSYGTGVLRAELGTLGSCSSASDPNLEKETVVGFDHEEEMIEEQLAGRPKQLVMEISDKKSYGTGVPQAELGTLGSCSSASDPNLEKETVVGFDHEEEMIKEQLAGGLKQLEVISIYGMGGSGKTTLAMKLYNDPYIVYHFYVRGWTYVSQEYRKADLLLRILSSIDCHGEMYTMTVEKLGEKLYKELRGKRYFIVMDDIWHIKAWNDLKVFFPDDCNGSRIILTSRLKEVALHAKDDSPIHFLRLLTEDESWNLLKQKVFLKETCPRDLVEIGKKIAKNCRGLPLAIVVIAGVLAKTDKTQEWWNHVAERVSSFLVSDHKQCLDPLALSYNHLPDHLKPCFLYFGAFPEDYEIPVQKLRWVWIAEGFIHEIGQKRLEDVAEEYLMDLIDRSLVLVAKKGSFGEIKACRVHDVLRDLCLKKAEEENFLQQIYGYEQIPYFFPSSTVRANRVSIHSRFFNHLPQNLQHIRSCLCYAGPRPLCIKKTIFIYAAFRLLKVLDLSSTVILVVTEAIKHVVDLRYLAIQIDRKIFLDPIFVLWNLETLIVSTSKRTNSELSFDIPHTVWKMLKLRHIHMPGTINFPNNDLYPFVLENLQTLSLVRPSKNFENVLASTPNLKKLGFCGLLISKLEGYLTFPSLHFSNHLETLKLVHTSTKSSSFQSFKFPSNLKMLTLDFTFLAWREISLLGMLPNLEVLKLKYNACTGPKWETKDGEFHRLKFLQLKRLDFEEWSTTNFHFPSLQHLVLHMCYKLKEIPSSLADIPTLKIMELSGCSWSAVDSARKIQEEQQSMGNDWLKIIIDRRIAWEKL